MNLQKLNASITAYTVFLRSGPGHDPYWRWESQRIFTENWDLESPDLYGMYDRSLQNSQTRRLWKRENYAPKDMMLKFIRMNTEYVRSMFQDLFNEDREVDGRLDRFVFYCDELLREYRETHPTSPDNSHFHDDNYEMISLYLSFRYPDRYAPYHFDHFKKLMEHLGSRDVPKVNDTARYFKVMRTVYTFLKKDGEALDLHRKRLDPSLHYQGETLLAAEDFCRFTVSRL